MADFVKRKTVGKYGLSASTLKLFIECPRCFWLALTKGIERPRGPFPSLPSGIDRVLKNYFDTYRAKGLLPPLIAGKVPGQLSGQALTLGFTDPAFDKRLWGKLDDCLLLPDGTLAPLDHKTRASPPSDIGYSERYYKFQMDVYTLLLERDGKPTSRAAYLVYYTPTDGPLHQGVPFEVTVHKLQTDPEGAYKIFTAACRLLQGALPSSADTCGYCAWLEQAGGQASAQTPRERPPVEAIRPAPARSRKTRAPRASARAQSGQGDLFD